MSCPNKQVWGDYHAIMTTTGPLDGDGGTLPSGVDIFGMTDCTTAAATPSVQPLNYAATPFQKLIMGVDNPTGLTSGALGSYGFALQSLQTTNVTSTTFKTSPMPTVTTTSPSHSIPFHTRPTVSMLFWTAPLQPHREPTSTHPVLAAQATIGQARGRHKEAGRSVGSGQRAPTRLSLWLRSSGAGQPSISFPQTISGTTLYSLIMKSNFTASRTVALPDVNVNMMVGQVASANLTGQTASTSTTTLLSSALAGMYIFDAEAVVTTAATTSSTLPNCGVTFTDADTSVLVFGQASATATGRRCRYNTGARFVPFQRQGRDGDIVFMRGLRKQRSNSNAVRGSRPA